ncbi:MAG: lysophospholipid acyltransferase family protein [Candidatus Omnitrophota bacterium]
MGQALALALPLKLAYKIAVVLGDVKRVLSPRDTRNICANFRQIFGPDDPNIHVYVKEIYRNFSKYLVDFFRFSKINKEFIEHNVRLINLDNLGLARKKGKGAIAVTAHLGNWELAGVVVSLEGYPLVAVTLEHKNKKVNDFFQSQRKNMDIEVVTLGSSMKRCFTGLKENKVLALVGDRDFTHRGVTTNFFGKTMQIPKGPAWLSLTVGAPIVPGFLLRDKDDKFRFIMEKPIEYTPTGDMEADIFNLTNLYLKVLERYIKDYPEQWFVFRKFWEPAIW